MRGRSLFLTLLAVTSLGTLTLAVAPGIARAQGSSQGRIVSMEFQNVEVREALRNLFKNVGVSFTIDPNVQGTVNLSLKNVPFETALQQLARQVEATYRVEGGVYQVVRTEPEGGSPIVEPPVQSGYERIMLQDESHLYVLTGNTVYKISKSGMKVEGRTTL